jgi:hypothetical protein
MQEVADVSVLSQFGLFRLNGYRDLLGDQLELLVEPVFCVCVSVWVCYLVIGWSLVTSAPRWNCVPYSPRMCRISGPFSVVTSRKMERADVNRYCPVLLTRCIPNCRVTS